MEQLALPLVEKSQGHTSERFYEVDGPADIPACLRMFEVSHGPANGLAVWRGCEAPADLAVPFVERLTLSKGWVAVW
ncbi:MAG: hypothetical protein L0331_05870 [Chloroflexi bacterium]|nr:hypothetical protein [Chloroflexota bacterium]